MEAKHFTLSLLWLGCVFRHIAQRVLQTSTFFSGIEFSSFQSSRFFQDVQNIRVGGGFMSLLFLDKKITSVEVCHHNQTRVLC